MAPVPAVSARMPAKMASNLRCRRRRRRWRTMPSTSTGTSDVSMRVRSSVPRSDIVTNLQPGAQLLQGTLDVVLYGRAAHVHQRSYLPQRPAVPMYEYNSDA